MSGINALFMFAALLLFISVLASTLSARLGFPLLLLFLTVGMVAGEDGIGGIRFDDFFVAGMLGQAALGVILLDGGLRTRFDSFRVALKPQQCWRHGAWWQRWRFWARLFCGCWIWTGVMLFYWRQSLVQRMRLRCFLYWAIVGCA